MSTQTPIDYLKFRARFSPDNAAYISLNQQTNFADFMVFVQGIAAQLRERGVKPGQNIAINHNDSFATLVAMMAVFHEGANCCMTRERFDELPIDYYVVNEIKPYMPDERTLVIDRNKLRVSFDQSLRIEPRPFPSIDESCVVFSSSGTTGDPKLIALSPRLIDRRFKTHLASRSTFGPVLIMIGLRSSVGFQTAMRALISGEAVCFPSSIERALKLIESGGITEMLGSPAHYITVAQFLANEPYRFPQLRAVYTAGAPMPTSLLAELRASFCRNIVGIYGSSEAGATTLAPTHVLANIAGAAGYTEPGVEVEIVDENDNRVPPGVEGIIRVRTDHSINEYPGNREDSIKVFRDGWFYPGDLGVMDEEDLLIITGREVDVINAGGMKVNPLVIEDYLTGLNGITDAAAFGTVAAGGINEVWAAVISSDVIEIESLLAAARSNIGGKAPVRIVQVGTIPRNENGIIQRDELREKVEQMVLGA